jgi:coniferyl-aldehyde dehydrogenase
MSSVLKQQGVTDASNISTRLAACLTLQRKAYLANPNPDFARRKADLLALKSMVIENQEAMIAAISSDYGNRSRHETLIAEIIFVLDGINFALKQLKRWMKPQRRHVDVMSYPGASNRVIPQPLGVVGVIVPWNFPLQLSLGALTYIFAAGNRAMVKMSENSNALARLLIALSPSYFPSEKLAFFAESGEVGIQFSQLPFDHLLFTGSSQTGRAVMAAAAKNLTPVTLELGGKSPAVVAPDYPVKKAVERILFAKLFNAGQVCVNVDYVFVPEDKVDEFVAAAKEYGAKHCPDISSPDYTAIIDQRSFVRLQDALADAANKGATLVNLSSGTAANLELRKLAPHIVLHGTSDMVLLQREIFGPIMPVLPYRDEQEVVQYINRGERPLSFYPFTNDTKLQGWYLDHVMSGGVSVNEVMLHTAQHDLPFGGVGGSGMGHYHGTEGFNSFSKLRPVFYQARFSMMKFLAPPYGKVADWLIRFMLKLNS